jgi:hypothetical protein
MISIADKNRENLSGQKPGFFVAFRLEIGLRRWRQIVEYTLEASRADFKLKTCGILLLTIPVARCLAVGIECNFLSTAE